MILGVRNSSQHRFDQLRLAQHRTLYLAVEFPLVQPELPVQDVCSTMLDRIRKFIYSFQHLF